MPNSKACGASFLIGVGGVNMRANSSSNESVQISPDEAGPMTEMMKFRIFCFAVASEFVGWAG